MNDGGFAPQGWAAVLVGVVSLVFTLVGAEITTVAAAESEAGEKIIARLTTNLIVRMLLFYILSVTLIMCRRAVARDGGSARDCSDVALHHGAAEGRHPRRAG